MVQFRDDMIQFVGSVIGAEQFAKSRAWLEGLPDEELAKIANTLREAQSAPTDRDKKVVRISTRTVVVALLLALSLGVIWLDSSLAGPLILAWLFLPNAIMTCLALLNWRALDGWSRFDKAFAFRPWVVADVHCEIIRRPFELRMWVSRTTSRARDNGVPLIIWYPRPRPRGVSITPGYRVPWTGAFWISFPTGEGAESTVQEALRELPTGTSMALAQNVRPYGYVKELFGDKSRVWVSSGKVK